MISTVTTTVSTIVSSTIVSSTTTVSSSAIVGLMASLSTAGVVALIASMAMKELATSEGPKLSLLRQNLDIIIRPLLFVFTFIATLRVWEALPK